MLRQCCRGVSRCLRPAVGAFGSAPPFRAASIAVWCRGTSCLSGGGGSKCQDDELCAWGELGAGLLECETI